MAATSMRVDAVTGSMPAGMGRSWPAGTMTYSAYPPPASRATTSSPSDQPSTSVPREETVPVTSRPMISETPFGGG